MKMKIYLTRVVVMWIAVHQLLAASLRETPDHENTICRQNGKGKMNSFLWTLKRDPPSYFFGTIHVPYNRVWDYIPENTKVAFRQADSIFFELDLTDPYTMTALAKCQMLPHGENLSNILPKDVYTRLKDHLAYVRENMANWITPDQRGKGLYADYLFDIIAGNWERKRPIWVMLLVNSLTESEIKSREVPVLDLYMAQEAERLKKMTGAVERVEEQCVPLNDLNLSQVVFALNQTLWQHESYRLTNSAIPVTTDDLIQHYNCGDLNEIIFNHDSQPVSNLLNASLPPNDLKTAKLIDDYFRTELINKRNHRMAMRVASLFNENPDESFFFALGAGHFLGNNTVIDKLINMGFNIEHTPADAEIPRSRDNKRNKNRRRDRLQKEFGGLWDQMDEVSRNWLEQTRTERRKKHNPEKTFNDLWIRMGTPNPGLLQQLVKAEQSATTSPATIHYLHNDQPRLTTWTSSSLTILLFLVLGCFL